MQQYVNVSAAIGILVSTKTATLHELDTVYGIEDMMDMLEILYIDAYNKNREFNKMKRSQNV